MNKKVFDMDEEIKLSKNRKKALEYVNALMVYTESIYQIDSQDFVVTDLFVSSIELFYKERKNTELKTLIKKLSLKLSNLYLGREKVIVKPSFQIISGNQNRYLYEINQQRNPPYRVAFAFSDDMKKILLLDVFLKGSNRWESILNRININKNRIEERHGFTFFERGQ
jgi:hypothetical protein